MQVHRAGRLAVQAVGGDLHLYSTCCLPRHAPHPGLHTWGAHCCTIPWIRLIQLLSGKRCPGAAPWLWLWLWLWVLPCAGQQEEVEWGYLRPSQVNPAAGQCQAAQFAAAAATAA